MCEAIPLEINKKEPLSFSDLYNSNYESEDTTTEIDGESIPIINLNAEDTKTKQLDFSCPCNYCQGSIL